tara:strand:+ start:1434 stop:1688 length:255 start_codon:yes stop_codon:yes gene_type:complete
MLRKANRPQQTILLMNEDDFVSKHNSELLGYLEDVPGFKVDEKTLNFTTNMRIGAQQNVPVLNAFNIYLQQLSREVQRIIIKLN